MPVLAQTEENGKKIIFFVYDNSISMINNSTIGAQAQYAVKAFCAMSDPEDEIKFYKVGDFKNADYNSEVEENGYEIITIESNSENYRDLYSDNIDEIKFDGENTFYTGIHQAINDIKKYENYSEKWVVMFTDGEIEKDRDGNFYSKGELQKLLEDDLANSDVNFYYVNIADVDKEKKLENTENMTFYYSEENETVLSSILSAIEKIYGKRQLSKENIEIEENAVGKAMLKAEFGIPVTDIAILLQGEELNDGDEENFDNGADWSFAFSSKAIGKENKVVEGPDGIIMGYDSLLYGDGNSRSYDLEIEIPDGSKDYAVYYTPALIPQISITSRDNDELLKKDMYVEGNYDISVKLIEAETGKDFTDSELLSDETYELTINSNTHDVKGTWEETLEQGTVYLKAETKWGQWTEESIDVGENLKSYTLEVDTENGIFYYNRLNKKENSILVSIFKGNDNVTAAFQAEDLNVEFYQWGESSNNITYEVESDVSGEFIKIYPMLREKEDKSIFGNLTCKISLEMDSDYYVETVKCDEQEITLNMDVEDNLFEVKLEEKSVNLYSLLCLFGPKKIKVRYFWNEEEIKWNEIDQIENVLHIAYEEGEEEKITENNYVKVNWKLRNYFNFPTDVEVISEAVYTAHGKEFLAKDVATFSFDECPDHIKAIIWMINIIILILGAIINIFIIISVARILYLKKTKDWSLCEKLAVERGHVFTDTFVPQIVKKKFVISLDYYFEVHLCDEKNNPKILQIETLKDTCRIRVKEDHNDYQVFLNRELIENNFKTFRKDFKELSVKKSGKDVFRIKLYFRGRDKNA